MTRIVLLGPPGVGKGTQARIVAERLGVSAISTGQIFRDNMSQHTALGELAEGYISKGLFVPDSVTNSMVEARLGAPDTVDGFLLDGYPRNLEQAHVLRDLLAKNGTKLDIVLDITAPHDVLVAHMLNRAQLENRADDSPEVFAERLHEYALKTEPVSTYYADQDLLSTINGVGTVDEVTERILAVLSENGALV